MHMADGLGVPNRSSNVWNNFFALKLVISKMVSSQIDKMRDAADQLVKAALDEATITKPIISLKEVMDERLRSQSTILENIRQEVACFKSMEQGLGSLKKDIGDLKTQIILHSKKQTLEWAIVNCKILKSFEYYNNKSERCNSSDFLQQVLISFRQGFGHYITNGYTDWNRKDEESQQKFREMIQGQLYNIIGKKPRIVQAEHGWCAYYE
jgi:hypothetical protein